MRFGFTTYQSLSDEDLIGRVAGGSHKAFDELYARYGQKLFAYFFRMLWKNKELAEDFTHDVFIRIMQHSHQFEKGRKFSTWLYSIAHNMCKNEYRKQQVRQEALPDVALPPQHEPSPELSIDLRAFKGKLETLVEELDEERKALFILRFEDQQTVPEIASILGIPEGTVKSKLFYMLRELTQQLRVYHTSTITS